MSDLRLSLRFRIIAVLAAVLAAGAVVLGAAAWHSSSLAAQQAYDRLLRGGAVQIAENVYVQGGVVTVEPPVSTIATLADYDLVFYKVVDPRGIVVAGYEDLVSDADPVETRAGVVLEDGTYQGQPVRIATLARQIDMPGTNNWSTIVVAQTTDARRALARDLTLKALGVIAVMSVLALLAAAYAVTLALKPLTRIEREIASRRPDDLRPIEAEPPLEIRNLVQAIDDFMRRLSERMAIMQRFIADAAHQIRTPLAALDAQVEILIGTPASRRKADTVKRIHERTAELGRLTGQLLDHAMVIHRKDVAVAAAVDLNQLAKGVLAKAVPLSLPREVDIAFVPAEQAPIVSGDAVSLREALSNLIDNALRHGARSRLVVTVGADGDAAWIEVADDGDGFAAPLAEFTRPFAKGPESSGSGLGLSIAAEVALAHKGELALSRDSTMTRIRLVLARS
ncbi:sensor histidine kinase [Bosea sp. SSUT16]|uniref:histidine kinase n=1 Tax=Bosea spartocytisi TaxID=2773451 RepID=A0A927E5A1_9HYPH|nr:sensor histidine kinase [Bosea spartocytisi]MBD3845043.1 sensor histidine kinase [Bosea spartocytisi]MCT4471245.1 sensor histidine kinase [Bosea spartocytisi]